MMRKAAISLAFSMTLAGPALAQTNPVPIPAARPAPQAARPAIHPVSKSADPTFDEGTYQRISAAMLSYSSIEVRGGWPMLPAGATAVVPVESTDAATDTVSIFAPAASTAARRADRVSRWRLFTLPALLLIGARPADQAQALHMADQ